MNDLTEGGGESGPSPPGGRYVYLALRVVPADGYPGKNTATPVGVWTSDFFETLRTLNAELKRRGTPARSPGPDNDSWLPVELLPAPVSSNMFSCHDWVPLGARSNPSKMIGFIIRGSLRKDFPATRVGPSTVHCGPPASGKTWLFSDLTRQTSAGRGRFMAKKEGNRHWFRGDRLPEAGEGTE